MLLPNSLFISFFYPYLALSGIYILVFEDDYWLLFSMSLICLYTTGEWDHSEFVFLPIANFAQCNSFQFHPSCSKLHAIMCYSNYMVSIVSNIPQFLYPSSLVGHSSCYHILPIVVNAAMNIEVHICLEKEEPKQRHYGRNSPWGERDKITRPCLLRMERWDGKIRKKQRRENWEISICSISHCRFSHS